MATQLQRSSWLRVPATRSSVSAGPGVLGYEINILTAPPLPPQVLAQGTRGVPHPTVGANDQCIRHPYPLPMRIKIDLHLVRGQGMVAVRAYRK